VLDSLFFSVLGIAMLLTVLTAFDRDEIAWPIMAFFTWLACAVIVGDLERPYAFILTDNTVQEHLLNYSGGAPMIIFFGGIAIIFIAIFFNRVLTMYKEAAAGKK